jgi:dTMP kinase
MPPLPPRNGRFITIEGPEGAGKTVVGRRLRDELERRGLPVLLTREPGGTRLGERLREVRLSDDGTPLGARTDALLFNAARAQLVLEVIAPSLDAGEIVICARFADSTLAYQGYGAGVPIDDLRALAAIATGGLEPDLTLLLDVPADIAAVRRQSRPGAANHLDRERQAFHDRVRAAYRSLAAADPRRWRVIDAARCLTCVQHDVWNALTTAGIVARPRAEATPAPTADGGA